MTKGLFLFHVSTNSGRGMLLVSKTRDITTVSKTASGLTRNKNSEFYGSTIRSVEFEGTLDN